jgi:hypothetical protein
MILTALLSVICGEASFVVRARRERDELRNELEQERMAKELFRAEKIRAQEGWKFTDAYYRRKIQQLADQAAQ